MTHSDSKAAVVYELAEGFLERYRQGERPALKEYIDRHPDLADEIREVFPAMAMMENIALVDEPSLASPVASAPGGARPALQQLGDYRIVREVGRGGMGVVYEAEQVSLDRHVALKLLPEKALADPRQRLRFEREARAAAKLHHTNIVPVFGVGEHEGTPYYVMQFIQGLGLDKVLEELRRLQTAGEEPSLSIEETRSREMAAPHSQAAADMARSLLTGRFQVTDAFASAEPPPEKEKQPPTSEPLTPVSSGTQSLSSSSINLPGQSHDGAKGSPRKLTYWQSVAHIGVQVADALEYAHKQGIIHRDIKPSNLLLDTHGVVWVTDFGLAKLDDQQNLTQTGDLLGTFRYMPPEAFDGKTDARSDVYSLAVTLYEMLAFRPAFDERDRARLVKQVTTGEPPRLRRVNRTIPRDLATIVHKGLDRDPHRRYPSAGEFAADLQRFLDDRPIQARQTGSVEQLWRWCRRNPGVASLMAAVVLLLSVIAIGGMAMAGRFKAERDEALIAAKRESDLRLFHSLIATASAVRMSGQPGQRFHALEKVREALALRDRVKLSEDDLFQARNVAAAALCLPDLVPARHWPLDVSPNELPTEFRAFMHGRAVAQATPGKFERGPGSRDGRFVLVRTSPWKVQMDNGAEIWRVDGPTPMQVPTEPLEIQESAAAFSPDGERLACGKKDGTVSIYATENGRRLARFAAGPGFMWRLAWHPDCQRLAVVCGEKLRIWDTGGKEPTVSATLPHPTSQHCWDAAFHPGGRIVATAGTDGLVRVWELPSARLLGDWKGFQAGGALLAFNPAGDRLIGMDWSYTVRMWDAGTGRELARVTHGGGGTGGEIIVTGDGSGVVGVGLHENRIYELQVAPGRELRVLNRSSGGDFEPLGWCDSPHPQGRLLIVKTSKGAAFVDLVTGRTVAEAPGAVSSHRTQFDRTGALWTVTEKEPHALVRWPVVIDQAQPHRMQIGPPEKMVERLSEPGGWSVSDDGSTIAVARFGDGAQVIRMGPNRVSRNLGPQHDVRTTSLSSDGKLAATRTWHADDGSNVKLKVWDTASGRLVANIPVGKADRVTGQSADGRWLFTTGGDKIDSRKWDLLAVDNELVPPWEPIPIRPLGGASPDGRLVAREPDSGVISLRDGTTDRELVRLPIFDPAGSSSWAWSADGTRLFVTGRDDKKLYLYDLRLIRTGLAELGLDWDHKSYPPADSAETDPMAPPLEVTIVGAELLDTKKNTEAATRVGDLKALFNLSPKSSAEFLARGRALSKLGWGNLAMLDYSQAIKADPRSHAARSARGSGYIRRNNWAAAQADFTASLDAAPDCYFCRLRRGWANYELGKFSDAAADFEWCTGKVSAEYKPGVLLLQAAALDRAGQPDVAKQVRDEAAKLKPNLALAANNFAWWYVTTEPSGSRIPPLSLLLSRYAVNQAPEEPLYLNTLGVALYRNRKYAEARDVLEKSLKLGMGKADAFDLLFLTMCHARLGDKARADECFDRAVRWMEGTKDLPANHALELRALRTEAEASLRRN